MGMGGNFASATPDTAVTHAALERCALTVQVSTKLNVSHLVVGDQALILPTKGRTERHEVDGVRAGRHGRGLDGRGARLARLAAQAGVRELLSEVEIVCAIAEALRRDDPTIAALGRTADWGRVRPRPRGRPRLDQPGRSPASTTSTSQIATPGGFVLPHGPRDDRTFATPDGRAHFTVNEMSHADARRPGTLLLQTMRSHDQYNTTIYGLDDRYRGIHGGRRVVFVQPRRPRRRAASATATWSTCDRPTSTVSQRVAPRLPGRRVPDAAGHAAPPTTPRPTCSCRWHSVGRSRHPHVQVDPRRTRHPLTLTHVTRGQTPRDTVVRLRASRRRARPGGRRRGGCGT